MAKKFLDSDGLRTLWEHIKEIDNSIATNSKIGHIKSSLYHSVAATGITPSTDAISIAVNNRTNTAGRFYAIETDSNGFAFVNVPWTDSNTNYYPTKFAWTNGTTSGPTGSLTGSGMSAVSFGAIPSASATSSGIVTTGTQTFAGTKTFNANTTINGTLTVKGITASDDILPKTGSGATLGIDSQPWSAAYITTVHGSLDGNATTATTSTNLAAAPSLAASGNNITVTAGGKTSTAFTVPYASSAGSVTWANVSGKPSSFTPSAHTHAYTQLTGSTTIANQAIVSSGTANGWTLKTLGSNAFNSTVIPTKVSQLTNDSGFITNSSLSGYLPLSGGTLTGTLTGTTIAANTLKAANNTQLTLSADGTTAKAFVVDNNTSSFRPAVQNTTSSLGTSSYNWNTAYIKTLNTLSIRCGNPQLSISTDGSAGNTIVCDSSNNAVRPLGNKTANLGLTSYQWNTIWGGVIYENGQTLSSKYALKSEISANVESITNSEIDEIFI